MATTNITLGGGPIETAPGSSPACDSCGATDELKEWESRDSPGAKVYRYCKVCWFDLEDSVDELRIPEETYEFRGACDDCGEEEIAHDLVRGDHTFHLCDGCFQIASVYVNLNPAKQQALECVDCEEKPATNVFHHLDGRTFRLCDDCYTLADHEEDYGASFGSAPRLRVNGHAHYCECPLPCDFIEPTRCELCKGIVVVSKEE